MHIVHKIINMNVRIFVQSIQNLQFNVLWVSYKDDNLTKTNLVNNISLHHYISEKFTSLFTLVENKL